MVKLELYDTTLRDGAQYEGISLSVNDKLVITKKLDTLGVDYIEGGWPGSNPKDAEFFERARTLKLHHAQLAAFGSTRRSKGTAAQDANIQALLDARTPVVTLVGKAWDLHVTEVLGTSLEENLAMIYDSVGYLKSWGRRVFFDAEHFFDGFRANRPYALQAIRSAAEAGADAVVLCDTNGGTMPSSIAEAVRVVKSEVNVPLGIHTHNDADTAVAGALAAVEVGATQVQATINGYGERCGNANMLSIIANLKLKMGIDCVTDTQLKSLSEVSRYVSEVANMPHRPFQPYVGGSAFTHKGGIHVQAVAKVERSYQHVQPEVVGNSKRVLVSELSGRSNILYKVKELGLDIQLDGKEVHSLLQAVKLKESQGFQYEGADASFELLVRRTLSGYTAPFELVDFTALVGTRGVLNQPGQIQAQAMVKVKVAERVIHAAADGNGPVNALDNALRKALLEFYPGLNCITLVDYRVRVVETGKTTASIVRVLIETTDGSATWSAVGASTNIIEASWMALADALEYWLLRSGAGRPEPSR